jgi:hypothetical protein
VFKVFVSVCVVVCCSRINSARACRTVRSPACNELLTIGGIFLVFIDAVLGYRRPAACNTELRGLLIVIYNVEYCF